MTREKAKQHSRSFCYEDRIDRFIDKIYDDFKSYACKNCKYSDDSTEGTMICRHPNDAMPFHVPLDFGCVPPYFEEKKEKTK